MKELNSDFICDHEIGIAIVNGRKVYFTELRINMADVPEGFHRYEIRSSDDGSRWATIEPLVIVNHCATILSKDEIPMEVTIEYPLVNGKQRIDKYTDIKEYEIVEDYWDDYSVEESE